METVLRGIASFGLFVLGTTILLTSKDTNTLITAIGFIVAAIYVKPEGNNASK